MTFIFQRSTARELLTQSQNKKNKVPLFLQDLGFFAFHEIKISTFAIKIKIQLFLKQLKLTMKMNESTIQYINLTHNHNQNTEKRTVSQISRQFTVDSEGTINQVHFKLKSDGYSYK